VRNNNLNITTAFKTKANSQYHKLPHYRGRKQVF